MQSRGTARNPFPQAWRLHLSAWRTSQNSSTQQSQSRLGTQTDNQPKFISPIRGSVRRTRGLGPTMTARGQSVGISIGMLPQTLIMSITVQKTSKYYTMEFDLEEGC